MSKIAEVAHAVEIGKSMIVPGLVQEALGEGCTPIDILNQGMIDAMAIVGKSSKIMRSLYLRCWWPQEP